MKFPYKDLRTPCGVPFSVGGDRQPHLPLFGRSSLRSNKRPAVPLLWQGRHDVRFKIKHNFDDPKTCAITALKRPLKAFPVGEGGPLAVDEVFFIVNGPSGTPLPKAFPATEGGPLAVDEVALHVENRL